MEACCIIGPTKGGTTLMGCLLDSHPELAIFPLEIKFFTHWLETLQHVSTDYGELNRFFLDKSKLRFLGERGGEADIMNSGRLGPDPFDYEALRSIMEQNRRLFETSGKEDLFKCFVTDIHAAIGRIERKFTGARMLVSKEGNHGLPHRLEIARLFPRTKFIVLTRDPRDIYVSLKSIAKKKRDGIRTPTFKSDISPLRYIFENEGKNIKAYSLLDKKDKSPREYCFVKYERLVEDPEREMKKVADFLGVRFFESLCRPTIFGRPWSGNASSAEALSGVTGVRTGKWYSDLTTREIRVLEYFFSSYLAQFEYERSGLSLKRFEVARDIVCTNYNAWPIERKNVCLTCKNLAKSILSTSAGLIACMSKQA